MCYKIDHLTKTDTVLRDGNPLWRYNISSALEMVAISKQPRFYSTLFFFYETVAGKELLKLTLQLFKYDD